MLRTYNSAKILFSHDMHSNSLQVFSALISNLAPIRL
jgi:hypothetical protein